MSMNLNQPTLYDFEIERSKYGYVPPKGSDTFYTIGSGQIDLLTNDTFELSIIEGSVEVGSNFTLSSSLYSSLYVYEDTTLTITRELVLEDHATFNVYGSTTLNPGTNLTLRDGSTALFQLGSNLTINQNTDISVRHDSSIQIYGNIYCHHSKVNDLYGNPDIYIDNSATLYVTGLADLGDRPFSLMEYTVDLRTEQLVPHSQGEFDTNEGKLGFNSIDVDYDAQYQLLDLFVMRGTSILGDFKYSVLGTPSRKPSATQLVNSLTVNEFCMLVVSDSFNGHQYINPTLYVGPIIDNSISPGTLTVHGDVTVSGTSSEVSIVLDRGGSLYVSETGTITLDTGGSIVLGETPLPSSFTLDGTLVVHSLDQLKGFTADDITLGEKAKIVVLNDLLPDNTILFSTPNGIHDTYLHQLFHNRMDHVVYHIPSSCGIKIDESMDEYRTMSNWFGGMRLEDAIEQGRIIWNDSFIELDTDIVPWAESLTDLYDVPKLFNTYPSISKQERLQELVDYLSPKGVTSIVFHITKRGKVIRQLTLNLRFPKIKHVSYSSVDDIYTIDSDNPGKLFLRNKLSYLKKDDILSGESVMYPITKKNDKINAKISISE